MFLEGGFSLHCATNYCFSLESTSFYFKVTWQISVSRRVGDRGGEGSSYTEQNLGFGTARIVFLLEQPIENFLIPVLCIKLLSLLFVIELEHEGWT